MLVTTHLMTGKLLAFGIDDCCRSAQKYKWHTLRMNDLTLSQELYDMIFLSLAVLQRGAVAPFQQEVSFGGFLVMC